ncbi:MAG TPA: siderophore-interacting protein [Marmoricola sp.]|nr:siderophore-interacting protein [Marmoricola sp.]
MNARPDARAFEGAVVRRDVLSDHLVRIVLDGLDGFATTGVPDEWVALTVPGQFQTRYYTVRAWNGSELTLDVVVHEHGLVTEWAQGECVGDVVGISAPKGSFDVPAGAAWVVVVGDLTALPAIARISESTDLPVTAFVETPDGPLESYLDASVTWLDPPAPGESVLAELVEGLDWPAGDGYFWMAGESAQMRAIRRHLRHDLGMPSSAYDVMGYWSGSRGRQARAVDPRPIYAAGRAAGKSDEEIWDDYDAARGVTGG